MERVDGEENEYLGKVDPDHLPLLEATQAALTMKIEAARRAREDGPTTRSAAKKSASRPDEVEKHPKAASLSPQAPKPSQAPSTGAIKPSAKPQETPYVHPNAAQPPQFRFAAPIEDPLHATTLAERSLDAPVSMSMRELLGVAPELRKAIKELVTAKKLPIDGGDDSRASFLTALDMPPANDLVSVLLNAFPAAAEKRVANNTESLRTISVKLDGRVPIDAILDEGSQIIGLRREVWERLGLPIRSDHTINMETANTSRSRTVGLLPNLKMMIGKCEFTVQAHVIEEAGYDMLLGRPFHVLAQAHTQHFANGGAVITLTDPQSKAVITVPTKARGSASAQSIEVDFCV